MKTFNPKPGDTIVTKSAGNFICEDKPYWQGGYDFYGYRENDKSFWVGWDFSGNTVYDDEGTLQVVEIIPAQQETPVKKTKPHKHAELIKAWADGAEIQFKSGGIWHDYSEGDSPIWYPDNEYRIKPEVKPDVVLFTVAEKDVMDRLRVSFSDTEKNLMSHNLKLTFDANTGELKSAEVI